MTTTTAPRSQVCRFTGRVVAGTLLVASVVVPGLTVGAASQTVAADQGASASQSTYYLAGTKRP